MAFVRVLLLSWGLVFFAAAHAAPATLVVYSYDSFMSKDGIGPKIVPLFEKSCGCKVSIISVGTAGQILTRIQLDQNRKKPTAHVVVGLDGPAWQLFKPHAAQWGTWLPKDYPMLHPATRRDPGFLPFDYGVLGFMQDRVHMAKLGLQAPGSLEELFQPKWKRKLLMQDPRTSTPGLSFLLYAAQVFSKGFESAMKSLRPQWLTLAPGWEAAYGLFLKGEAPLVWSYVTSQAYHDSQEVAGTQGTRRYEAVLFKEGQPLQVEGAAMVAATLTDPAQRKLAERFLDFLISEEVQTLVPTHNWMMPAREGVTLPASFQRLPKVTKLIPLTEDRATIETILKRWQGALQ